MVPITVGVSGDHTTTCFVLLSVKHSLTFREVVCHLQEEGDKIIGQSPISSVPLAALHSLRRHGDHYPTWPRPGSLQAPTVSLRGQRRSPQATAVDAALTWTAAFQGGWGRGSDLSGVDLLTSFGWVRG